MKSDDSEYPDDPRDRAAYWFARLRSGDATAADRRAFEEWRRANPENDRQYRNLDYFWDATLNVPEKRLRAILAKSSEPPAVPFYARRRFGLGLAGVCSAAVAAGVWGPQWWDAPDHVVELSTARGQRRQVTLPDDSVLFLNTGTRARAKLYADKRVVELMAGEILFHVQSNMARPFIVDAELSQIMVTGTCFDVRRDRRDVRVSVESGSVNVSAGAWWNRVTRRLVAGQGVVADANRQLGQVAAVDVANIIAWQRGKIVFENAPLGQVIEEMNRYLSRPASFDAPGLAQYRIAGVFSIDDPQSMMNALPAIAPVQVRRLPDGRLQVLAR